MEKSEQKEPNRAPDLVGPRARIWYLRSSEALKLDAPALVTGFIVHAPGSHPFWPWKCITVVTLKDVEGVPPAVKHFPDATHEILSQALDPSKPVPDPDGVGPWNFLTPPDYVRQLKSATDAEATYLIRQIASLISTGRLVPDSDYRRVWDAVLGQLEQSLKSLT